ncbi:MAG TPA: RNA methyltransferase [Bacteroidetes bacterium]|nr:RNA methyltransferase [Bacteroidota bacterium]
MLGLEQVLSDELLSLGAREVTLANRGVSFTASEPEMYKILLHVRTALRILVPLATGKIQNEDDLYEFVRSINWLDHLSLKHTFAIDCMSFHPTMNHNIFLSQKSKDAIVDQFREKYGIRPDISPKDPDILINIHIAPDGMIVISLDASGKSLNQRGYRVATGPAPLNEVLAAGLIKMTGWDPQTTFIDPMCGTGTFLIEAALMAKNKAPGLLHDDFGIQRWPMFRNTLWKTVQQDAREMVSKDVDWIFGSDFNENAIDSTIKNLQKARLTRNVQVRVGHVEKIYIPEGTGLIIMNPPYGDRIGDMDALHELYPRIGNTLKHFAKGYKAAILTGDKQFKKKIGLKHQSRTDVLNGKIECDFLQYNIF